MKVNLPAIDEILLPLLPTFKKDKFTHQEVNENPPLRSELFSKEQMEQHAQHLALTHSITKKKSPELLLKNLSINQKVLVDVNELLKESIRDKKSISPAAEWLFDNFYLIEEQIHIAKRYLPKGYSLGLPRLRNGIPRVYDIAIEIISHSDGHIDIQILRQFISSYQLVQPLTLGELWAIPIMLRLALLENLSRVATHIAVDRKDSALANEWAKHIIETVEKNPKDLVLVIADMARSNPPIVSAFVAEFARKLQWKGPEFTLPINWVEQHLSGTEGSITSMVLIENQKQAANQVSVSNSINSLRFLAKMDWREFVQSVSLVEKTLLTDIEGVYASMDFYSRDEYRHTIEELAKASDKAENEIAELVIDLAKSGFGKNKNDKRKAHVGYYLIGKGRSELEKLTGFKLSFPQQIRRKIIHAASSIYITCTILLTMLIGGLMIASAASFVEHSVLLIVVAILCLASASQLALAFSNWLASIWIKPKPLPRMDFSKGIPDEHLTLVAVPTLLASTPHVEKLLEELEVRFLANRDKNLLFALVTDFLDAPSQTMPEDSALLQLAQQGIERMNKKYHRTTNDTFFLFHRPRMWNATDKVWMGYERKRGKLSALNRFLRGNAKKSFSLIVGEESVYKLVKYVITLDSDTQLPREAAWKLVGLMAHPLNHAVYDEQKKRIVEGYSIIQPRIAISLHGAIRSGYSRLHENDAGIDPYTRVTSDIYQDLFGEGSFIGKGIYEIDSFEKALYNRFPENRILSHDLLEGCYARCGFASDVQLYEDYPSSYEMDMSRRHRWIRGDWQIGSWFLPYVRGADNRYTKNSISSLSRWKILDNLRRSFVPVAFTLLLVAAWTYFPSPWFWMLMIGACLFAPSIISSIWNALGKPTEMSIRQHVTNATSLTSKTILQAVFNVMCLPYEAYVSLDAIARTIWRVTFTRRKLLEWNPSGLVMKRHESLIDTYRTMWMAPAASILVAIYLIYLSSPALIAAAPFLILWIAAPRIIYLMDNPIASSKSKLRETQKLYLRQLTRKTWLFFEDLITVEDNWLPPDNLQEHPIPVVAHRTSPTNMGLALLANLAAHDFGYSTCSQFIERTFRTLATMAKLERFKGHFYNWYDTRNLTVLNPRYISTVDSGNLAGHLLTLRQGLLAMPHQKIIGPQLLNGLQDTLHLAIKEMKDHDPLLAKALGELADGVYTPEEQLPEIRKHYESLLAHLRSFSSSYELAQSNEAARWITLSEKQLEAIIQEVNVLAPWLHPLSIPEKFRNWKVISEIPTLIGVAKMDREIKSELTHLLALENSETEMKWLLHIQETTDRASKYARERLDILLQLASQCYEMADMEYDFLYDKTQHLLTIGYNIEGQQRDEGYYDLLASEARLGLFVAIAQGKVPQESWFALGRRLTTAGTTPVLLSWSGSMFEYLMPGLVMPTYQNTLLDEMNIGTVRKQIEYGELHDIPWGISESCYNLVDAHLTYQYKAFGIPGLGFKRGLGQDLVIAPYATVLALMVDPQAAYKNLEKLQARGFEGKYGFFEAIDFTATRLSRGQSHALIQTFMAHHQGMSLLSLAYLLLDQPMQKRFESDTNFQTALLLLQERVPKSTGFYSGSDSEKIASTATTSNIHVITTSNTPIPQVQLLSNGRYFVMISNAGGGYSRWKEIAITRWREDGTCDNWGTFSYINDLDKGTFWSTCHQPTLKEADFYETIFLQGRAEFRRRDDEIETHTVVIVSPEDDVEVRRTQLTNYSTTKRKLEVTSYGEVVLTVASADESHPAFSNLFVQTEIIEHQNAIVCTRRARSKEERPPWMFHLMKVKGAKVSRISYETDRSKFIGRGYTVNHPSVIDSGMPLSGSHGSVLDPMFSIRYQITLLPGESATIDLVIGAADTQPANQSLIDKYQDSHLRDRAFELSWTHSQVVLRQIGVSESDAQLYGKLASSILYMNSSLRTQPSVMLKNHRGQSALWSYSISGDLPIMLLSISDAENIFIVKQLIKAQAYWNIHGLYVDLVIFNEDASGYRQVLQEEIQGLIAASITSHLSEKRGRIFVRHIDQVSAEDRVLLQTVARVIISDTKGTLEDQVNRTPSTKASIPKLTPTKYYSYIHLKLEAPGQLQFFNGTGGFSTDGKEYVIITDEKTHTPLPWINVIANEHFGTIISERGSSYTWFENAHEFRITPWKNDPILDQSGEAFYLRDEESGEFWSPMGRPALGQSRYHTKHGFGYSIFEHMEDGLKSEVSVYVDIESPIKFVVIKVANKSGRWRKLTATGYVEWILGELKSKSLMHIVTELDSTSGALIAKNPYNSEFQNYVTFFDVDDPTYNYTTDRTEFIGRNGTLQNPEALSRIRLSDKSGAGMDSCAAIQVPFELESDMERSIIFKIGAGKNSAEAIATIKRFQGTAAANRSLEQVKQFWSKTLSAVQVDTPDASINILANGWLLYQVLSCRLWGRSGLYQSGGAFGFRDQLQDVLALMHTQPGLTRKQIIRCASRQYSEGDVQHWWHPPQGRGVRTLCSDDFVWLPYVTSRYVSTTGDTQLLDEMAPYIQGRQLNPGEESYYDLPTSSETRATVYDHCKQAILHALRFGEHGLPLKGSGDWNDGMNLVGIHGKGESVWLAFFLYDTLMRFTKLAASMGDNDFVEICKTNAKMLKKNIGLHGWDGDWYLRAYFDDGTPLGSKNNMECKIDAISQSWSVLSNGGEEARSRAGMQAVDQFLVNREKGLIQLLDPPFDTSPMDPGYIKGYLPGVRENGGQYTHAAIWAVMAFAKLGNEEKTEELLKLINPIQHGATANEIAIYKVEPYIMAADVYGVVPHIGRGGWTWYTGSAGWMYQLILESFLGLKREGNSIKFEPCIPSGWNSFKVKYRFEETIYSITVNREDNKEPLEVFRNDITQPNLSIRLINDGKEHVVNLKMGGKSKAISKKVLDEKIE
jgi:cyclic beta-1,2-glucan synthetase